MRRSVEGRIKNNVRDFYDNQRQAILLNPKNETYRIAFSQTNALLVRNIAGKATNTQDGENYQLSELDRQLIAQAIQASIAEAKAAIALNPQKASYWENLGDIYKGIINVAEGSDAWTISSYQRAIALDPKNPTYRLKLGGAYYLTGNYDSALSIFEQAAILKPDWSNAYYNLAWAANGKRDYQKAITFMEKVITLTDKNKNSTVYNKALQDLATFQGNLDNIAGAQTESAR